MSPRPNERLAGLMAALHARRPAAVVLWPAPHDPPTTLQDDSPHGPTLQRWRDWCVAHAGRRVRLGLSCRWSLQWDVAVPLHAGPEQAWQAACAQATHYLGPAFQPQAWAWRAWPLPGGQTSQASQTSEKAEKGTRPWLVVALPRALLADLRAVADAARVRLAWVGPWWADWLEADVPAVQLHDAGWLLQWRRQVQTGGDAAGAEALHLSCRPWTPQDPVACDSPGPQSPQPEPGTGGDLGRLVAVQGPAGDAGLADGPVAWAPPAERRWTVWTGGGKSAPGRCHRLRADEAFDFTRRAQPMAPWAWALPVMGVLGLVAGVWQWQTLEARHEALQVQQQRLLQAEHRLRLARAMASPPVQAAQAAHAPADPWPAAQQVAAQAVMARLGWPWMQGLSRSTAGVDPAHTRWTHWQLDLGELDTPQGEPPVITLAGWATHDDALTPWLRREPQVRWLSRERLAEPVPGQAGVLTLKGQWQMPWPEASR